MAQFDRTKIVRLLRPIWPELDGMVSSEVQAFLNQQTGCGVTDEMPNGSAFDQWRLAISKNPEHAWVWPYTQARIDEMDRRSREMKADEERRRKAAEEKFADGVSETD